MSQTHPFPALGWPAVTAFAWRAPADAALAPRVGATLNPRHRLSLLVDVTEFILRADPDRARRLGAPLPEGRELVDLQAGHFAMTGAPSPHLRNLASYHAGGPAAADTAARVVAWVATQRPPGTLVAARAVEAPSRPTPEATPQRGQMQPGGT